MEKQELGLPRTVAEIAKAEAFMQKVGIALGGLGVVAGILLVNVVWSATLDMGLAQSAFGFMVYMIAVVVFSSQYMVACSDTAPATTDSLRSLEPYAKDAELIAYMAKISEMKRDVLRDDVCTLRRYLKPKYEAAERESVLHKLVTPEV